MDCIPNRFTTTSYDSIGTPRPLQNSSRQNGGRPWHVQFPAVRLSLHLCIIGLVPPAATRCSVLHILLGIRRGLLQHDVGHASNVIRVRNLAAVSELLFNDTSNIVSDVINARSNRIAYR